MENSLTASANGTVIPIGLGLLGPFRMWIYPRIFRSMKVKKATASIMRINLITQPIILLQIVLGVNICKVFPFTFPPQEKEKK